MPRNTENKSDSNAVSPSATLSRRDFVKKSVAGGVGIAAASTGLFPASSLGSWIEGSENEFEYIVVGSGAGGGPVAANLAKAGKSVLLLEAGDDSDNRNYSIPVFHGLSTEDPLYAWNFFVNHYNEGDARNYNRLNSRFTYQDPRTGEYHFDRPKKGAVPKGILYPRAGTLGGCTAHNAMITMYPDHRDWNQIAELMDDSSWSAENMRGYFQRLENASGYVSRDGGNSGRHGFEGWLHLEQSRKRLGITDSQLRKIITAAVKEGANIRDFLSSVNLDGDLSDLFDLDCNGWERVSTEGMFNVPRATRNGRRNGTRELLRDARAQHGLEIRMNALVSRVVFDTSRSRKTRDGKQKALGVEYFEGQSLYTADPRSTEETRNRGRGRKQFVKATREVILAGGAFNTPQILMLSGIGDFQELNAIDPQQALPRVADRPGVGKNLQDRYEVGVVSQLKEPFEILKDCTFGAEGDPCMAEYQREGKDSLYATNGVVIGVRKRSEASKKYWREKGREGKPDPDLFIFGAPGDFRGYKLGWAKEALTKDRFTWAVLKGHTENTEGRVRLRSLDPMDTPVIDFEYFPEGRYGGSDPDLEAVVEGVKFAQQIMGKKSVRKITEKRLVPSENVQSDADLRHFVIKEAWGHHASCSNKMGPESDRMAVVDGNFRVHGTENLRVVDASVFPRIPGLFIVTPVYMVAEKASDVILKGA